MERTKGFKTYGSAMKTISGIRIGKFRKLGGDKVKYWIFAKSDNWIQNFYLMFRGYRPHHTLWGGVMRKVVWK